jgi:branched-chain amino acid transport system ATP-binding protein
MADAAGALLRTTRLDAFYDDAQALFGIDFALDAGERVAIIGANGAGKSTFLKTLAGLVKAPADSVCLRGEPIGGRHPAAIVARGVALVPEGRRLFPSLSVEENLLMGGYLRRPGAWNLERLYALFPALKERRRSPATSLSGGQQQMVAIGRALMSNPDILLCDELSLGLAPIVIREIYAALPAMTADGMAIVFVEQDVGIAQQVAQRVYCLQEGRVSLAGPAAELTREQISLAYFGV